jgi:hypothetical protein
MPIKRILSLLRACAKHWLATCGDAGVLDDEIVCLDTQKLRSKRAGK